MEKRWSERKELRVGVEVFRQGELLGSCFSHDIGLGGTFLGAECPVQLQKDTDVVLVFQLMSAEGGTRHKISARVARVADDGMGFKFCEFDTGVFRALQEIMALTKKSPGSHYSLQTKTV
jgi:hypothetical protein